MGTSHSQPRAANVLTTLVAKLNEVDAKQQAKLTPPSPAPRSFELPAARSSIATAIAKHQNPIDCASARYIVHSLAHKQNGMGSSLHVMTAMLGYAMQNNRVLIVAQDLSPCKANKVSFSASGDARWPWADEAVCGGEGGGLRCLFAPVSNCTPYVNTHRHRIKMLRSYDRAPASQQFVSSLSQCDGERCSYAYARPRSLTPPSKAAEHAAAFGDTNWWVSRPPLCRKALDTRKVGRSDTTNAAALSRIQSSSAQELPPHRYERLQGPPSAKGKWRASWWRSHAIDYLMRPSDASRSFLDARYKAFWHGAVPPSDQLISVHMRWGDLAETEMGGLSAAAYVDAVRFVLEKRGKSQTLPVHLILTSEDDAAITAFRKAAPTEWKLYFDTSARHAKRLGDLANADARRGIGGQSLFNLYLALEARAFVCTTGSNWCRLINELRKTRLGVHDTVFVDLCHGEW